MKYLLQHSRLQHLIQYRNGYLILASISLILNMLLVLVIFLLIGHERIVIVPPTIEKPFWVTSSKVSPEYLSEMSMFFTNLRLNVTTSSAATQGELLLRFIAPKNYNEIKAELLNEAENLKKNHITTAFFPINVDVDTKKLVARVTGDLQSTVGDSHLPSERVTYKITYTYNGGRLFVAAFEEAKSHG